jgi:hypothetical protein
MDDKKNKAQINITVKVSSESIDRQALQRALYGAGGGAAAVMYDYLRDELSRQLGDPGEDFLLSFERLPPTGSYRFSGGLSCGEIN